MRPNWVGWFLVALFFVGGMAFMIPKQTRGIWIGQIWVAVSLGLTVLYVVMIRRADRADELRRGGVPGRAVIKSVTQTGTYVNNQPVVKLDLEVHPEGLPAYSLRKRMTWPLIATGQLGIGNVLPVHVDPNKARKIVIDWAEPTK